jgi:hypothetical protein
MQLPALLIVDLDDGHAETPKDFEVGFCVAANLGQGANHEHRRIDAALQQGPRDDEAVAAVVPVAAEHGHAAVEARLVGCLYRGHHLTTGVFHQHQR